MRAGNRLVSRTYGQTRRQWLALLSKSKQDKLQTNTTEVPSMQDCVYIVFNTLNETDAHTKPLSLTHAGNFSIWGWWSMPTVCFIPPPPHLELVSWWLWLSWCPGAVSCAGLEFYFNLTGARTVCITISGLEIKVHNSEHKPTYFHKEKIRILQASFRQTGFRLCFMCTFNLFEACSYSQCGLWKRGHQALFWLRNKKNLNLSTIYERQRF